MALQSFVTPLPQLRVDHLLQFDFPAEYHAKGTMANIKVEPPAIEEMYGKLGTPPMDQAHPSILEYRPGYEDSKNGSHQFQTLEINRSIQISHTGRLSGNFVRYIAKSHYHSIVQIYALPIAPSIGNPIPLYNEDRKLEGRNDAPNMWYWKDPVACMELIHTAQAIIDPKEKGFQTEQIYKLVCKWAFWDYSGTSKERMPISGFDEAVTFEVIQKTWDM